MYCKLFASLYQGTLRGRAHEILVFTNLLAHCDRQGIVDKHFRAVADEVGLTTEEVKAAMAVLEAPDPESRSAECDGARIQRLDDHRAWGWRIVNYAKYRAIRQEDDRREQTRLAMQRHREQKAAKVSDVSQGEPRLSHAEGEGEAEAEAIPTPLPVSPKAPRTKKRFVKPTQDELSAYMREIGMDDRALDFIDYYDSKGWVVGKAAPMQDWKATVRTWKNNPQNNGTKRNQPATSARTAGTVNNPADYRDAGKLPSPDDEKPSIFDELRNGIRGLPNPQ